MPQVYSAPQAPSSDAPSSGKLEAAISRSTLLQNSRPAKNPFSAFSTLPYGTEFDIQHDDEHILLLLRQHPVVNVGWILFSLFLTFLPFVIVFLLPFFSLPASFQHILTFAWYTSVIGYIIQRFIMWYYNIYIITDERIIDIDFFSLLFKRVSETRLEKIEDITAATGGVIQSFFDYGDVIIQTAAEVPELEFEKVPRPNEVVRLISELLDRSDLIKKKS